MMHTIPGTHTRTRCIDISTVTALALSISIIRYGAVFVVCLTDNTIIDDDMRTVSHMTVTTTTEDLAVDGGTTVGIAYRDLGIVHIAQEEIRSEGIAW